MCGICGFYSPGGRLQEDELTATASAMAQTLSHRGPDAGDVWCDAACGIALGHRRLSILDLSERGRQPMVSSSGRYVVAYNGEIYNFPALREELTAAGVAFRGHSDTEVFLAAIESIGREYALEKVVGMFAFALWDRRERKLFLGRDRVGIKPLYYGWCGQTFLFGSELKALRAQPDFNARVDRDALALFFRHGYVPAPYSVYEGIYKLPAGCLLAVGEGKTNDFSPWPDEYRTEFTSPTPYWRYRSFVEAGKKAPYAGSYDEARDELERRLREAVAMRLVADVPLGAFLSGGIDSSLVTALMSSAGSLPVKTFTIGFDDDDYDEATYAREVARHLGTEHTQMYLSPRDGLDLIPELPRIYDEPFADSSQIPTTLLAMLTRKHVTVALSGDGGDELFAGYRRYFQGMRLWERARCVPLPLRRAAAVGMRGLAGTRMPDYAFRLAGRLLPQDWTSWPPGAILTKLAMIISARVPEEFYLRLNFLWPAPLRLVRGASEPVTYLTDHSRHADVGDDFVRQMMYLDFMTYHPDDILVKVDRASMSTGLEARVPLVDHRVAEFAASLPTEFLMHEGKGKRILRDILYRYVPPRLVERPKSGFAVPIGRWLRNDLRDWAETLLAEKRLRADGYLDIDLVRRTWAEHLSGRRDWKYRLWCVLMFQAWLDTQ